MTETSTADTAANREIIREAPALREQLRLDPAARHQLRPNAPYLLVAGIPVIWLLDEEEVLVSMKCDYKLMQETFGAEDSLKWHLEGPVSYEGNSSIP